MVEVAFCFLIVAWVFFNCILCIYLFIYLFIFIFIFLHSLFMPQKAFSINKLELKIKIF